MWAFIYPLTVPPSVCFMLHGFLTVFLDCILVPLTLAGGSSEQWAKSQIIRTLVLGGVLFPIFVLWEARFAKNPVLPASLLKDRGVWGPLCGTFSNDFTYYIAADYLYPVLIVSVDESSKSASRITWLPTFIAVALSPFVSVLVPRTKRPKLPIIRWCALWMVSLGMFYHYTGGAVSHAGIISASVVMEVGSAVGASVPGAMQTQSTYHQLAQHLGNESLTASAYRPRYTFVAEYVWGTPGRNAAVKPY